MTSPSAEAAGSPRPLTAGEARSGRRSDVVMAAAALARTAALAGELDGIGVALMVLKGSPVQRRLLGTEARYRSADVDVLVRRADNRRTRRYLVANGWRFSPDNGVLWRLDRAAAYVHGGVTVDLHWGLHAGFLSPPLLGPLEAAMWEGARRRPDGWYEPALEPLAVYLAVHAAAGGFARPEVLELVDRAAGGADPAAVAALAERIGIGPVVDYAIALARGLQEGRRSPPLATGAKGVRVAAHRFFRTRLVPGWLREAARSVPAVRRRSRAG